MLFRSPEAPTDNTYGFHPVGSLPRGYSIQEGFLRIYRPGFRLSESDCLQLCRPEYYSICTGSTLPWDRFWPSPGHLPRKSPYRTGFPGNVQPWLLLLCIVLLPEPGLFLNLVNISPVSICCTTVNQKNSWLIIFRTKHSLSFLSVLHVPLWFHISEQIYSKILMQLFS